jgi:carbonic anhydrase
MQIHAIKSSSLIKIQHTQDIPAVYRNTPIEKLLKYQNLKSPLAKTDKAELLVGMCMDNRKQLRIPDNFAFIIRSPGANLEFSHFPISYVIGVAGVKYMAIIGHDDCAMVNLDAKKDRYIDGLVKNAEWSEAKATQSFAKNEPIFEIHDEVAFILDQTRLLRKIFPPITIVPMIYKVKDNLLYLIKE